MTFEETWIFLLGDQPPSPELDKLKVLTLGFYKAGETQGVTNADRIVASALAEREAQAKETRQ